MEANISGNYIVQETAGDHMEAENVKLAVEVSVSQTRMCGLDSETDALARVVEVLKNTCEDSQLGIQQESKLLSAIYNGGVTINETEDAGCYTVDFNASVAYELQVFEGTCECLCHCPMDEHFDGVPEAIV